MTNATAELLKVLRELRQDGVLLDVYGVGRHTGEPLALALNAWAAEDFPGSHPIAPREPDPCCYIGEDGARCTARNEFGGFCPAHDTEIDEAGGDNSPGGSAIIKRSALQ